MDAQRGPRGEQMHRLGREGRGRLAQRLDRVEDPDRAPVRRDDEVVVVNGEIADHVVGRFNCSGCQSSPSSNET